MQHNIIKHSCHLLNDYKLCYWDNENLNTKKVLISFSAGFDDGSELVEIAKYFPKDIRLISPAFPGRGGSHSLKKFDNFANIAQLLALWIEELNLSNKKLYIWGTSYGTAVLNELLKISKLKLSGIILLTPGEFLNNDISKEILKKTFKSINSKRSLRAYLQNFLHLFPPFNNDRFIQDNTKSLNEQWLATLDYKIDTDFNTSIPTLIIKSTDDKVITADSINKIYAVYQNHKIVEINHEHIINFFEEKEFVRELINKYIIPFINE